MALSRLLLPKPKLYFHKTGFVKSTGGRSSSSFSGWMKKMKEETQKEKEADALELDLKKSMEMHSELPKPTNVPNKAEQQWSSLKGMFTNLKSKMLGGSLFQVPNVDAATDSAADKAKFEIKKVETSRDYSEVADPTKNSETIMDSRSCREGISHSAESNFIVGSSTSDVVDARAKLVDPDKHPAGTKPGVLRGVFESSGAEISSNDSQKVSSTNMDSQLSGNMSSEHLFNLCNVPNNSKHESQSSLQTSEAIGDSHSSEESVLVCATSSEASKRSSEDMGHSVLNYEHEHGQLEEGIFDELGDLESEAQSGLYQLPGEVSKTLQEGDANGLTSVGYGNQETDEDSQLEEGIFDELENLESEAQSGLSQLPDEVSTRLQEGEANGSTSVGYGNQESDEKTIAFYERPSEGSIFVELPTSPKTNKRLANLFVGAIKGPTDEKMQSKKTNSLMDQNGSKENSNQTSGGNMGNVFVGGLVYCIKDLPGETSDVSSHDFIASGKTDQTMTSESGKKVNNKTEPMTSESGQKVKNKTEPKKSGSGKKVKKKTDMQKDDSSRTQNLSREQAIAKEGNKMSKSEKHSDMGNTLETSTDSASEIDGRVLDVTARKHVKLNASLQVDPPTTKKDLIEDQTFVDEKESSQNKALVRFMSQKTEVRDILFGFKNFDVVDVKLLSSTNGSNFKDALVHFKTCEAMQKALFLTDLVIRNGDVVVEATSFEDMPENISIPSLIGDPDVPIALVKNPTRTVKINRLTNDISSHQLIDVLGFFGSGITSLFYGSSSSDAYVEFETEDAKENALAQRTVHVLGKQLSISRIDVPRTTVVRIMNVNFETLGKFGDICKSYGKVRRIVDRHASFFVKDVHFKLSEWPNMCKILNSLNGLEKDGKQWVAQPAPVFHPLVLKLLWSQPEERKRVKSLMIRLYNSLRDPIKSAHVTNVVAK